MQLDLLPDEYDEEELVKKDSAQTEAQKILDEEIHDEAINFIMDIIREIGPTNSFGVWVKAKEKMGIDNEGDVSTDIIKITVLLHVAGHLWMLPTFHTNIFGIKGEHDKDIHRKRMS